MRPPGDKVSPGGSEPDASDHVYGVLPPVAARVCEYADPTVPEDRVAVVMVSGTAANGGTDQFEVRMPMDADVGVNVEPLFEGVTV